jgi:hypothetical protein
VHAGIDIIEDGLTLTLVELTSLAGQEVIALTLAKVWTTRIVAGS